MFLFGKTQDGALLTSPMKWLGKRKREHSLISPMSLLGSCQAVICSVSPMASLGKCYDQVVVFPQSIYWGNTMLTFSVVSPIKWLGKREREHCFISPMSLLGSCQALICGVSPMEVLGKCYEQAVVFPQSNHWGNIIFTFCVLSPIKWLGKFRSFLAICLDAPLGTFYIAKSAHCQNLTVSNLHCKNFVQNITLNK